MGPGGKQEFSSFIFYLSSTSCVPAPLSNFPEDSEHELNARHRAFPHFGFRFCLLENLLFLSLQMPRRSSLGGKQEQLGSGYSGPLYMHSTRAPLECTGLQSWAGFPPSCPEGECSCCGPSPRPGRLHTLPLPTLRKTSEVKAGSSCAHTSIPRSTTEHTAASRRCL